MFCRICNREIKNNSSVCPFCGAILSIDKSISNQEALIDRAEEDKKSNDNKMNTSHIISLVVGATSLLLSFIIIIYVIYIGLIIGIVGIIFSLISYKKIKNKYCYLGFVFSLLGFLSNAVFAYYLFYLQ